MATEKLTLLKQPKSQTKLTWIKTDKVELNMKQTKSIISLLMATLTLTPFCWGSGQGTGNGGTVIVDLDNRRLSYKA